MNKNLQQLCKKAAEIINSIPKGSKIRVVSHYDADGISAAAIISKSLYRAGYNFHTSLMRNPFDKGLQRLIKEDNELIIFTDMGSGQIETLEKFKCKIIIIDHHQYLKKDTSENILQINANLCNINGNYEACGATLAFSLAIALNEENIDLVALAITGAIGDKQYVGGIKGYNKEILDTAIKKGFLKQKTSIKLYGETLFDSLYFSTDPYYSGISGNEKGINDLLKQLNLSKEVKIENLNNSSLQQLQSYLMFKLIRNGCEKNILETIIRPRYKSEMFDCELERLADLLDACGKGGNRGIGLSICMGDNNFFIHSLNLEKKYKQKVLDELLSLEKTGIKETKSFRYFYSKDSSLGGVIGGIASNYIFDKKKPLISIVHKDDELHVSCRGNQHLVKNGLDLGYAMKEAAGKLGGHGGGHKIASGATIAKEKEEDFLKIVDGIISEQMGV